MVGRKTGGDEGKANQQMMRWKVETTDQHTHLSIFVWWESNGVVVCVTFKFVCFDGIEGKKLADEVQREKGERKKENKIK